jgi:hypothetical protein
MWQDSWLVTPILTTTLSSESEIVRVRVKVKGKVRVKVRVKVKGKGKGRVKVRFRFRGRVRVRIRIRIRVKNSPARSNITGPSESIGAVKLLLAFVGNVKVESRRVTTKSRGRFGSFVVVCT